MDDHCDERPHREQSDVWSTSWFFPESIDGMRATKRRRDYDASAISHVETWMDDMPTGIHGENHVWVMFVSEETFPDKVLHLCDGGTSLEMIHQKVPWNVDFITLTIECPRKCRGFVADHWGYKPDRKTRPCLQWL
jgi:hypothetical protein